MLWLLEFLLEDALPWLAVTIAAIVIGLWMSSDNVCTFVGRYAC